MADNKEIKDGLGNLFNNRMKDLSPVGDGSIMRPMTLATPYPIDYGAGGMYQTTAKSFVMAAGLAASSPVLAFWLQSPSLIVALRRIKMSAWSIAPFTAGLAVFEVYMARQFTVQYTGGAGVDLSGNNAKLRTSMPPAQSSMVVATTGALTAGTRVLDTNPFASQTFGVGTVANTPFSASQVPLYDKPTGDHPLIIAQYEGFAIKATVPAAGTWGFTFTPEWDEIPNF